MIVPDDIKKDPRFKFAFPQLNADEMEQLKSFGTEVKVPQGGYVFRAGDRDLCMFLVVNGEMTVHDGRTKSYVATHRPGSFSGDVDILSGRRALVDAVASTDLDLVK